MKIVVVGSGGREHALAHRFISEGHEVVAIPGNPGISEIARCVSVDASDVLALTRACVEAAPELVVVGPEAPLAAGLADRLVALRVPTFGPGAKAARIESSKGFAKDVMARAGVPTASFAIATSVAEADAAIDSMQGRCVVKADGLAAGKGVVVCGSVDEAREAARNWLKKGPIVIEERLEGPEVSIIALTDGTHVAVLPPARDHKRLRDGDEGPNTGGMGAICPVPLAEGTLEFVRDQVMRPVLKTLAAEGKPFVGALYAGLMLTRSGPKVLEFNARFGDPETQAITAALSTDVNLGHTCLEAATGRLSDAILPATTSACVVVVASAGYPESPRTGDPIGGLDEARQSGARVFHAGTKRVPDRLVSAGGRVLGVVGTGATLTLAREAANRATASITLEGAQWRRDIGASS